MSVNAYIPNGNSYIANVAAGSYFTANISSVTPTNQWLVTNIGNVPVFLKFTSNLSANNLSPNITPGTSGVSEGQIVAAGKDNVIGLNQSEGAQFVGTVNMVASLVGAGNTFLVITPIVPRGF